MKVKRLSILIFFLKDVLDTKIKTLNKLLNV